MDPAHNLPATEMVALRKAAERDLAELVGRFVFAYSRLETSIHLCVGWFDHGSALGARRKAERLGTAELLDLISRQVSVKLCSDQAGAEAYGEWVRKAHEMREVRNILVHSRCAVVGSGDYLHAVSTPVLVEPSREHRFTAADIAAAIETCEALSVRLGILRKAHQL